MFMGGGSGVAAMVHAATWCDDQLGLDVLSIGRSADNLIEDCVLEMCGKWLAYRVALRGGWVFLKAQLCDAGGEPELLFNAGDGASGWKLVCRLVAALALASLMVNFLLRANK